MPAGDHPSERDVLAAAVREAGALALKTFRSPVRQWTKGKSSPVSEVTIAGNLVDMFANLTPANDLEFKHAVDAPTVRVEGLTVAGR